MRTPMFKSFLSMRGFALMIAFCCVSVTGPVFSAETDKAAADAQSVVDEIPEPARIDLSFTLPEGQSIEVDNPYGNVNMRFGGYEHQLDMRAIIQQPEGASEFTFKPAEVAGHFVVAPTLPDNVGLAQTQRIDLVLYVPQGHAVSVRTGSGNVEARGLKSNLTVRSSSGNIGARGIEGTMQAETDAGKINVLMFGTAPPGSQQRFTTRTGNISLSTTDSLDADVTLATTAPFATDYSLQIEHLDGKEPDKVAHAVVGAPKAGKQKAEIMLESLVGEVHLLRRAVFVDPE